MVETFFLQEKVFRHKYKNEKRIIVKVLKGTYQECIAFHHDTLKFAT